MATNTAELGAPVFLYQCKSEHVSNGCGAPKPPHLQMDGVYERRKLCIQQCNIQLGEASWR